VRCRLPPTEDVAPAAAPRRSGVLGRRPALDWPRWPWPLCAEAGVKPERTLRVIVAVINSSARAGLIPTKAPFTRHPPLDLLADSCVAGSFGPREGLSLGGGAPLMTSPSVGSALARCGHWHPQPHTRRPSRLGLRIDDLYHTAGYARDEQPAVSARCAPTDFTHTRRPASVREMPSGPACRCANAHARGDPMCATCSAGSPVRYRRGWGRASGW
jgi:hypothetical protein